MAKLPDLYSDPTLEAMNEKMEEKQRLEKPRNYLGMSEIGDECWRKLFYSFRNAKKRVIPAKTLKAIEDGYLQEDKTIERLRDLPFIELINDDGHGNQLGVELLLGHFKGHNDGVIRGILQAPLTWHVFEHKAKKQSEFNKLQKIINEKGEKNALIEWDITYYGQAQIYMHTFKLERHYLICCLPGGRDHVSCRTEYNKKYAENLIEKAKVIIFDNWNIPAKLSENREFFQCKWCAYQGVCHDGEFPLVHCKTCRYSEPVKDGRRHCLHKDCLIEDNELNMDNCPHHIYNPALISAKCIDQQPDCSIYETEVGVKFANCPESGLPELKGELDLIMSSIDLYKKIKTVHNITRATAKINKVLGSEEVLSEQPKAWDNTIFNGSGLKDL